MLAELYIRNFAIIDELRVRLGSGLNVLTGETGAGKSIILDAMALVLGDRADTTMVRGGCSEAYVEAVFELAPAFQSRLAELLSTEGLENEQENLLVLAREVRTSGRNICRVNGRSVNLALLRDLGDRLVDIHGQGEHLSLLSPRSHLPLLDAYSSLETNRHAFGRLVTELSTIRKELRGLRRDERALAQRADLLKFQVHEIETAKVSAGEENSLRAERRRLANVEELLQFTQATLALLTDLDEDNVSVVDMMGRSEREISQLAKLDPALQPLLEQFQGLAYQLSDISAELLNYQDKLEFDPRRLNFIEERLDLINRLKRKYGDDIESVLKWQEKALEELNNITNSEERIEELVRQENALLVEAGDLAQSLSSQRKSASMMFASAVEQELTDLHMERAKFEIGFTRKTDETGVFSNGDRFAFDETGIDQLEFLVSANPGESVKPLARVASGGETSRLMLALKTVLARVDSTPTLIFDEIDQGIGGRVGDVVGRKLWRLTTDSQHQVIVVTHLPQLAGYADRHFHVSKQLAAGRTTAAVTELLGEDRIQELAAMLGTRGEHATGGARSILTLVADVKTQ